MYSNLIRQLGRCYKVPHLCFNTILVLIAFTESYISKKETYPKAWCIMQPQLPFTSQFKLLHNIVVEHIATVILP
jgi:hypothetical protein